MIVGKRWQLALLTLAVSLAALMLAASAQSRNTGVPNAMQGFSQNRDQPVHIEAATLEVRDKEKVAVFSGDVHVVQGDTDMRCKSLVVFYEPEADKKSAPSRTAAKATPAPGGKSSVMLPQMGQSGQQRIRRLEARGGVVVKRNDQVATGKTGIFDMKTNTVTLAGDVVVSQGPNVTRGDHLVVDLTSGVSRIESGKNGRGRVRALIQPGSAKGARTDNKSAPDAARAAPGQPLRLN